MKGIRCDCFDGLIIPKSAMMVFHRSPFVCSSYVSMGALRGRNDGGPGGGCARMPVSTQPTSSWWALVTL
jgi:hypothetical protein